MKRLWILLLLFSAMPLQAQIGIGTTTPDASSVLEVRSTVAGILPPRLTTAQRDAILAPAVGLFIYNTTVNCLEWWNGSLWFNGCGTTYLGSIANSVYCLGKTISKTPCNTVAGASVNDDPATAVGIEYDWSSAMTAIGATTNIRALVEIGGQCWCRYNSDIPNTNLSVFSNSPTAAWSGYYNDGPSELGANEGRLYQWAAAMQGAVIERSQGICPAGFHVPSDCEWMYLENTLGMSVADQQNLFFRNSGNVGQDLSGFSSGGTNSSGFTGLLGGFRVNNTGIFSARNTSAYWWTSSESSSLNAVHRGLDSSNVGISRNPGNAKAQSFCVRCLKD